MTSHDFEVDLEALATAVTKLSELQERNKTYDVADYTPNSGMVADPVVVGGLDSFNTKWDQGAERDASRYYRSSWSAGQGYRDLR